MDNDKSTETKNVKGEGMVVGCLIGPILAVLFIIAGSIFCATGIGAIIGIPLILGGIAAPFLAPFIGRSLIKGQCPYCGSDVSILGSSPGVNCSACKKRIVIRDKKFFRVE